MIEKYITTRHGGLYLNGIQLMQDQVENYDAVLKEVKQNQLKAQNLMTASQIFEKIEAKLKGVNVVCEQGEPKKNGLRLAAEILNAFDELGIFVATNHRRLLILPRKDRDTTITIDELADTFDKFILAIDARLEGYPEIKFFIQGKDLCDIWLRYLTIN